MLDGFAGKQVIHHHTPHRVVSLQGLYWHMLLILIHQPQKSPPTSRYKNLKNRWLPLRVFNCAKRQKSSRLGLSPPKKPCFEMHALASSSSPLFRFSLLEAYLSLSLTMLTRLEATLEATSSPFLPMMPKIALLLLVSWQELMLVWKVYWQVSMGCQNKLSKLGTMELLMKSQIDCSSARSGDSSWVKYLFYQKNQQMGSIPVRMIFGSKAITTFMAGHRQLSLVFLKSRKQDARSRKTKSLILRKPS